MKGSEVIKKALESDMPDMEIVRKKCIEELQGETEGHEGTNQKKTNRNVRRGIYAGMGLCAVALLCAINLSVHSDAESFIARLQTWLHINQKRVTVGEMKKDSIRIPEDCEEVEYGGEKYLTKSYLSPEELEEDIGRNLEIWRGVDAFEEDGIMLRIVDGEYARVDLIYDISKGKVLEYTDYENKKQDLKCCIIFPLSEDFSMNDIKLEDQFLKDAVMDSKGNLISYAQNGDYSIIETYYSEKLDTDVSVIMKKKIENIGSKQDFETNYYYLYFVYKGLSYQIDCHSTLETAKSVIEELE